MPNPENSIRIHVFILQDNILIEHTIINHILTILEASVLIMIWNKGYPASEYIGTKIWEINKRLIDIRRFKLDDYTPMKDIMRQFNLCDSYEKRTKGAGMGYSDSRICYLET